MGMEAVVCGANFSDSVADKCPLCSTPGKRIKSETIKNILKEGRLPGSLENYNLCLSTNCDVVYFGDKVFKKKDIKVRVWFKETEHPIPVCYCKNVTEKDILNHIRTGCCKDIKDIQKHTGANTGRECLTKNPAGT